jgi:hypothetical protein
VDPVPDPLLLRKSGSAENRTRTSGSVAMNSEHQTTEEVFRVTVESRIVTSLYRSDLLWGPPKLHPIGTGVAEA